MPDLDESSLRHETTGPDGEDLYVCETCGQMFTVNQVHPDPTQCPWSEYHE